MPITSLMAAVEEQCWADHPRRRCLPSGYSV